MKALVTGGAGFIGSHTADALLARGYDVRVLDSLEEPVHQGGQIPGYLDPKIEFIHGDVCDQTVLLEALQGCDVVYHFAAFQDYLPIFSRFFLVNAVSTASIFELIVREGLPIKKVVVASSQAAMGEGLYKDAQGKTALPDIRSHEQLKSGEWDIRPPAGFAGPMQYQHSDEIVSNPQNPYGLSKISQESITMQMGRRYGIPSVAMRYSIVQGPRQSVHNAYSGACRIFSLSFHEGRDPSIYEDGQQVRDFVNIEDVVAANILVMEGDRANFNVFNVGGDKAITVSEFAETVASVFGRNDFESVPCGKFRFGDTRHIRSDVSKLKALGWSPQRDTRYSVEAYREWLSGTESLGEILKHAEAQMEKLNVVQSVGAS
ncbi:MAG: NAD-dependent epimerase/dehydratase family protein [Proteobacteria bacterium]|nr:NAD-dependent epimerase/dehydratase family protein [Pseudomonadota bacterium]